MQSNSNSDATEHGRDTKKRNENEAYNLEVVFSGSKVMVDNALSDDAFRRRRVVAIEDDVGWWRHHRDILHPPPLTRTRLLI